MSENKETIENTSHAPLAGVVESSNCVHYGLIDLGYSDLFWCEDCRNKVLKIEDLTRASGYRMEIKK